MTEDNKITQHFRVGIITASDRCAAGKREDRSGALIRERMDAVGGEVIAVQVLPDDRDILAEAMRSMADTLKADLILTTGGTGLSPRDVTPEATLDIAERMVPGISETMRAQSLRFTQHAMLTRGVSCIRGRTLIINLPGNPKAVGECLDIFLPVLEHALEVIRDQARHESH